MNQELIQALQVGNTPGYWYSHAYIIASIIYIFNNPKKNKESNWVLPQIPIWVILEVFMILTAGQDGILFVLVMLVIGFINFFSISIAVEGDIKRKIYYTIRTFILGEFAGSLGWQVYYFIFNQKYISHIRIAEASTMFITYAIVFGIAFFAEKRHQKSNREFDITGRALSGIAATALATYAFSNLSYVVTNTPFTTMYNSELYMIRTGADFMGVVLLYMYHELMMESAEKVEALTIKHMLELQYSQYQASEQTIELVNQKYHDLKHQIRMLQRDMVDDERSEYLDQMMKEIRHYEAQYKTGNRILDTVLSSEAMKCQSKGIEITCVTDGYAIEFMQPMDISALFFNALDNAIEGTEKIENPKERLIYLTVDKQKSFIRIHVENTYTGKIQFRHHLPVTTKSNKNVHGYGVKSMKQIAEKYGGSIRAEAVDGWFKLYILIPIPR
ncbi:ATP-binding protein [Pseudobutyrivibrio xylanivorans]|uniref:Sensor histidine kinase n=1 Tax=Pseudobutyrivibrio xylanivorans TaxID=185007 RepID=A0A5P6VUQ4_PSEXY|nr:ATP-binding protein [Pseudobutyrivibrio xylanivorans]QFJ54531.1 sensor histidine kinase [Pseudobutyrivibrio xylanivorans]